MSCCGASIKSQQQSNALKKGLIRKDYVTADPNEAGSHWRSDWSQVKVLFNGKLVSSNTYARASTEWIDLYVFDVKTSQIATDDDGQPVVQRHSGKVDIYAPATYVLNIQERDQAKQSHKQSQWWPKT